MLNDVGKTHAANVPDLFRARKRADVSSQMERDTPDRKSSKRLARQAGFAWRRLDAFSVRRLLLSWMQVSRQVLYSV